MENSWGRVNYLRRSPEALLMGDAFTAVADDEYTLFYNPAALGRHGGLSLSPFKMGFGTTNIVAEKARFRNLPSNDPGALADRFMGSKLYLAGNISSGFKFHHYGLSTFASLTNYMRLENAIHPNMRLHYRYDRGLAFGGAFTFGDDFSRNNSQGNGLGMSVGLGFKRITRKGLAGRLDIFGNDLLQILQDSDSYDSIRSSLGHASGSGWGFDVGIEGNALVDGTLINMGFSILDVGGTIFKKEEGNVSIPKQEMITNFGSSLSQDFGFFDYTVALDVHPMLTRADFGTKLHLGTRIGLLSLWDIYLGWNAGYWSYGAAMKIFMFRLIAGFYSVEGGNTFKANEQKELLISFNLVDFEFDAF
ncbi:MAG: hypothetical protein OXB84_08840 [Halobacteriovoraceae bacterium]|nr:hypothetical protein [Halobacteriovoraceae bacterium]